MNTVETCPVSPGEGDHDRPAREGHPPGPKGIPYFGCLPELRRNPMRFSTRVAQTYGGIARIPLGRRRVYLVSEPTLLHELLIGRRDWYTTLRGPGRKDDRRGRFSHFQMLVGDGLLLSEGDLWNRQRLIAQPAFRSGNVYRQVPWMAEFTHRFFEGWASRAGTGEPFDVDPEFFHLSRLLAGEMIFGPHFAEIAEPFCECARIIKASWPKAPRSLLGMLRRPSRKLKARFDEAVDDLDALTYRFLEERRRHDFEDTGLVTMLVQRSAEQGEPYDNRQLRDQIMNLFFAGHETSATALSWIHYLLCRHPVEREKLEQEVAEVIGDRLPTAEDVKRLTYVEQVVNESLRLYTPIHSISKVAIADNTIGGYRIPKGSTVFVSLFATHRLPQYWPDPEKFDPDRFTPEESAKRPAFSFIPFSSGHRNCIGGNMAISELKMVVAQLAQRYRLEVLPGHPIELEPGTTMYPRHGMQMTLHSRRPAA